MSTRVYGWDQNPAADRFAYRCSDSSAVHALESGRAVKVTDADGREAIQLRHTLASEAVREASLGFVSVSAQTILMFIKTHCQGDKLHYEIPMAGDRSTFARHHRPSYFAARICRDEKCECHPAPAA